MVVMRVLNSEIQDNFHGHDNKVYSVLSSSLMHTIS